MPQLTFQIQQQNLESTESPVLETLVNLMSQCNINYGDMQQHDDSSVMVDFQNEEDATKALDNLNGIDFMGATIAVKTSGEEEEDEEEESEDSNQGNNKGQRQNRRHGPPRFNKGASNNYNQNFQQQQQPMKMEQYPCRLLIPSHMVKVVLGKSGSTITSIQSKTSTKIDIHRDKGSGHARQTEDTLASIKGEPTAFSNAIREILLVMYAELESNEDVGDEEEENEEEEEKTTPPLQLKLLAHDLLCGRIIGKGGNNLKQVRQESGVKKLIISNSVYDEGNQFGPGPNGMLVSLGERVVTMEGTVDAICEAEKVISQKLRDYMEKDLKNSANNPNMNNPYYGGQMGNYYGMSGGGGGGYPQMQMMYPRQYNPYQMGNGGYYPYASPYANNYPGLLGQGYPPFTGVMVPPPQALYGEEERCAILIPTKEVGAIIGRNGSYINKVKQYSHAQVRVVKGEDGGESRVEVRGTPDAQWRASLCVFGKIKETMKVPYSEAQLKTEFMVQGNCVGRIIGKKGQVVQDIQDKAQADIEVPKDKQGGEDVPVYITGTFNGTQMAMNRIRDIMQRARTKPNEE